MTTPFQTAFFQIQQTLFFKPFFTNHPFYYSNRAPVGSAWLDLVNTAKKLSRDVMTLLLRLSVLAQCSKHAMQTPLWLLEPPKYPLPLRRRSLKEK